jgi:hypothetical protein
MRVLIFLILPAFLFAQNLNLRLTTSAYMWQRQETQTISTNHLRAYQFAQLSLSQGNLSFHTFANFSNDFRQKQSGDPHASDFTISMSTGEISLTDLI